MSLKTCAMEGCTNQFKPKGRGHNEKRYCSETCRAKYEKTTARFKDARRAIAKKRYYENYNNQREYNREYSKAWRRKNHEYKLAKDRAYREANRERIRNQQRQRYRKDPKAWNERYKESRIRAQEKDRERRKHRPKSDGQVREAKRLSRLKLKGLMAIAKLASIEPEKSREPVKCAMDGCDGTFIPRRSHPRQRFCSNKCGKAFSAAKPEMREKRRWYAVDHKADAAIRMRRWKEKQKLLRTA